MRCNWSVPVTGLLMLAYCGCAGESSSGRVAESSGGVAALTTAADSSAQSPLSSPASVSLPRHIIRDGELRFETKDRNETRRTILGLVSSHQGYVSEDHEDRSDLRTEETLVVRVPSSRFDAFLEEVSRGIRYYDVRRVQAIDVSDEFVDIEARLKTKKETEERYRELLKQANGVEDILKVEEQIDKLRADIESTEGRLRLLQDREGFSTLRISFYQPHFASSDFRNRFVASLRMGWLGTIEAAIVFAALWPLLAAGVLVAVTVRYFRRKRAAGKVTP